MADLLITQAVPVEYLEGVDFAGVRYRMTDLDEPMPASDLRRIAPGYRAIVSMLTDRIDRTLIESCPDLRVVANCASGYDNVDVAAASERGIVVTNTPGVLTDATADLTMALLLGAARRVTEGERFLRAGKFQHWVLRQAQLGQAVHGATLGIFGMGRIGKAVARRAHRGFDMRVLYHNRSRLPEEEERELGVSAVDFDTLLAQSDFLSIHCPLSAETHHAFGAEEFRRMKPTAVLVNTSRGAVIDEAALAQALRDGEIWGAGLDVFEHEPAVDPALLELTERVVLLPHLGSATEQARRAMVHIALENALAVLAGRAPRFPVNTS